jgi:hypothetical protein
MGVKRILNIAKSWELANGTFKDGMEHIADRCYKLIPTIPTFNLDPELSRKRPPKWLSEETGERIDDEVDMDEAIAGAGI